MSDSVPVSQRPVTSASLTTVAEVSNTDSCWPSASENSRERIPGNTEPTVAHHVDSLFNDGQREKFDSFPQQVKTVLLETSYLKNKGASLTDKEFERVLAAAGDLESHIGSTSIENMQLFANAALGTVFKPGDTELILKALDSLSLSTAFQESTTKQLGIAREAMDQLMDSKSMDNYSKAYGALADLVDTLPKGNKWRDNIAGLAEQLRSGGLEELRDQFKQELIKQFHGLEKGGSTRDLSVSFEIGAALGLLNIDVASLTVEVKYTFTVFGSDDTKIRAKHNASLGINVTGGGGDTPVELGAGGNFGLGTAQSFPDLDSFVNYHANDMVAMLAGKGLNKLKNIRGISQTRQADSLNESVVANNHKLQQGLRHHGLLGQGDRIEISPHRRKAPVYAKTVAEEMSGKVGVGIKKLSKVSGGVSASTTRTHFTKHTDLLQQLNEQPGRLKARTPNYFTISVPFGGYAAEGERNFTDSRQLLSGQAGLDWMDATALEVSQLATEVKNDPFGQDPQTGELYADTLKAKRAEIKDVITALYREYETYSDLVNQRDAGKSPDFNKEMAAIKHKMEGDRGAVGRGEYLRAVICSHVALTQTYLASFSEGEAPHLNKKEAAFFQFLKDIDNAYSNPQMNLDQKRHIEKHLTLASTTQSRNTQFSGNLSVKIPGVDKDVGVVVKYNNIQGDINPDNDGKYLNLAFSVAMPLAGLRKNAIGAFFGETVSQFLSRNSINTDLPGASLELSGALDLGSQIEINMVQGKDNKFHIQYIRATESSALGGKTSVTAGAVKVGGGLKVSSSDHLSEWLGDNTLTYLQTKFNGWAVSEHPELWQRYTENHKKGLEKVFGKLTEPSSNAAKELEQMTDGDEKMKVLKSDLMGRIEQWKASPGDETFKKALDGLNNLLSGQFQAYKADAESRLYATKL